MKFQSLVCATTLLLAGAANAQTMKPGLWEITNQMQGAPGSQTAGAMAEMQKQLASMPPEQRKMMEDMMAKKGVQMGAASGGGMAVKVCITPEMAARNDVAQHQQGDCSHTNSPRVGNTMKFAYVCTKPPSRGEGQVTFTSPEAYSMQMKSTTTIKGKEESMDMQANGKWLGSDCGSVKPLGQPKQ